MRVRRKTIQRLVQDLLSSNKVGRPAVPVDRVARSLGIDITEVPGQDELSGFLLRNTTTKETVIGVNESHHANRQRFTIAHEIGHFLLHEGEPVHVDKTQSYRIANRSTRSSAGEDPTEIEANAFAAELLMPAVFLRKDLDEPGNNVDLSDDAVLEALAARYKVSVTAMTFRLANLGYLRL
jgi:Zn-dependent peptidase ImmA (M78 family)